MSQHEHAPQLPLPEYEAALYLSLGKTNAWICERMALKSETVDSMKKRIFTALGVENIKGLQGIMHAVTITPRDTNTSSQRG